MINMFDETVKTAKEVERRVKRLADAQYAKHTITPEGPGRWYCAQPNTMMGSFRVVTAPGHVLLFGDMPDIMLRVGSPTHDTLPWLRGAATNTPYLLEKAVRPWGQTKFYRGDALDQLREWAKDEDWPELAAKVRDALGLDHAYGGVREFTGEEWLRAVYDAGHDEPPHCCWYSEDMLWAAASLRKFVELEALLPLRHVREPLAATD